MLGTPNSMQKNPRYFNVLLDIYDFFEKKPRKIGSMNVLIDPGIGFGKTLKHNLILISRISLYHSLGLPILVGTSEKNLLVKYQMYMTVVKELGGQLHQCCTLFSQGVQVLECTMF